VADVTDVAFTFILREHPGGASTSVGKWSRRLLILLFGYRGLGAGLAPSRMTRHA
jgi:hypothetical protein